ncbi:hypothetical protein [Thermococcus sp. GR4]|uniref:hypothetical protein n=1 Tax=Thermococcus sp. GR4 TaxID=1638254 RepID=UPI0014304A37|nr:hypothetical protein [Thermococcus sp. GR4]NJE79435.1 hypothetical protein [Thermococcus sp. GR4]
MRRKALAFSLLAILLVSAISGCIGGGETKTVTVTKTVGSEESTTSPAETTQPTNSITNYPTETTTQIPTIDCSDETWREDFEKAISCALQPSQNHNFDPVFSLSLTGNKTQDALTITDFLVNYVPLDEFVENQSMKKGHYYNIKTPYELFQTRRGTYADMALFGAYALARDGFETYIFYVETKNGFGALPGFKVEVNHPWVPTEPFVIFWPFRIPLRLSAALEFLNIAGETVNNVTVYEIKYENGEYHVEKLGTAPGNEFKFKTSEFSLFGAPHEKTLARLIRQTYPNCKYTTNLSEFTGNQLIDQQLTFPYGALFYSVPFEQRYTEILYSIMIQDPNMNEALENCLTMSARIWNADDNYNAVYDFMISTP